MIQRTLHIDPSDVVPIWRQIEEGMAMLVATGALRPGLTVPSVRELARDLRINPATVAKAYRRLVASGIFEVERGRGTLVAEHPPIDEAKRTAKLGTAAQRYAATALNLGAQREPAVAEVEKAWALIQTVRRQER